MQSPEFWQRDGAAARLLDPIGRAYGFAGRLRRRLTRPWRAPVPVVCVGNLTAGGTGKTPLVILLARRLRDMGRKPHVLTRGYGGRERGPLRVDPAAHDARAVGDEALLLAAVAPTWVGADRRRSAEAAVAAGADVLLMDDGFQNPGLHQDLALVVVDGELGFGNRRLLPAGPLREPLGRGLRRADGIVIVGEDRTGAVARLGPALPCLRARLRAAASARDLIGRRALAFAGIGRPGKFYQTLEELGVEVVERRDFADHHRYRRRQLLDLLARAGTLRAFAVTTAKDLVRIPAGLRYRFRAVEVELVIEQPALLDGLLAPRVGSRAITSS